MAESLPHAEKGCESAVKSRQLRAAGIKPAAGGNF